MNKVVLVSTLNATGPIPNAASVLAHMPTDLILLRRPAHSDHVEQSLSSTEERMLAWCSGNLEGLFGFEAGEVVDFNPTYPEKSSSVRVVKTSSWEDAKEKTISIVEEVTEDGDGSSVRFESNAGRKEDAALMAELCRSSGGSLWYTDVESGISVEISGEGGQLPAQALCAFTRFWLAGFPIIAGNEIRADGIRYGLLREVLDSLAELGSLEGKQDEFASALSNKGIEIASVKGSEGRIRFRRIGEEEASKFSLDCEMFGSDEGGWWLEDLAALCLADSLGAEARILSGVRWTQTTRQKRRQSMITALRLFDSEYVLQALMGVWRYHFDEGSLPEQFKTPNLDSKSRVLDLDKEYRVGLVNWIVKDGWHFHPLENRRQLLSVATTREADVLAFSEFGTIFVECKKSAGFHQMLGGITQIRSLVGALGSHRKHIKIIVHSINGMDVEKPSENEFALGWDGLREIEALISQEAH